MADRLAVMNAGEIVQIGPPDEVYERPQNLFVADFLGTINIFDPGVLAPARTGLRPEKIQVKTEGKGKLRGVLRDEAYYGDVSTLLVRLDSGQDIRVARTNRHRAETEVFAPGDPVVLTWDEGDMIAFEG